MKNLVHCFSSEVVSEFLETDSSNFELIAAVMMQRLYEEQWQAPTMIGFYMTREYAELLKKSDKPNRRLLWDALKHGIQEDHQIDFVITSEDADSYQEFQLKRFGLGDRENTTDGLIAYLNEMERRYSRIDATCLVAIVDIQAVDLPRVRAEVKRRTFLFRSYS